MFEQRLKLKKSERALLYVHRDLLDAIRVFADMKQVTIAEATHQIVRVGIRVLMDYEDRKERGVTNGSLRQRNNSNYWRDWFLRHSHDQAPAGSNPGQTDQEPLSPLATRQTEEENQGSER